MFLTYLAIVVIGYLLGCFPTAIILSGFKGVDIRSTGSGNAGTTNMLRTMGYKAGILTFVGDSLKALIATLIGLWLAGDVGGCVGGAMAVVGHAFPIFRKFKGGKGVASSFGVMIVLSPLATIIATVFALVCMALTRIVSLNSMIAMVIGTILMWVFNPANVAHIVTGFILAALVIYLHRDNIKRLKNGTENKLDFSRIRF